MMKKVFFRLMAICVFILNLNFLNIDVLADAGYSIRVNTKTNCVTIYNGKNQPVKAMACSVGKRPGSTPTGTFYTTDKYRWRELFGGVYGQYATRICDHILFHSVYYTSTNENTLNYEEYNKLGTAASMGCVRLSVADAKWIYDNCGKYTKVTIVNSDTDALPKPKTIKITTNSKYPNWDPTDPHPNNPWKDEEVKFDIDNAINIIYIEDNLSSEDIQKILEKNVNAYDIANNEIPFKTYFDFSGIIPGEYLVKYSAKDILGNYGEACRTIEVCQKIHIYIDGKKIKFDELPILNEEGITFIPVRTLFENFGMNIQWDSSKRIMNIEKDGTKVSMKVGENSAKLNSASESVDIPIKIINGRILAPLKTLCELLDYDVEWNQETKEICIEIPKKENKE